MGLLKPVFDFIDTLVHPSAQQDVMTAARHRAFIAPRVLGSLLALACLPVYLVLRGAPTGLEVAIFVWLLAPMLVAAFLSQTGRYETAHILSSVALTGLVSAIACRTGGIASFAAIWLVVVPLEAALSASRRVVAIASGVALFAALALLGLGAANLLPAAGAVPSQAVLAAFSIISAALYATGLALNAETLARTSFWLLLAEEDRYRLLARNMTDVITRHGPHGAVLFVSPAARPLFGASAEELRGHGLFDRVQVADRPAYLTALADAASGIEGASAEFRVRRTAEDSRFPEFVWVEMRCRPVDDTGGAKPGPREVVAVMRDITERKSQDQAIEDARAKSEQAHMAKTRFLATMSHELRTPLNAIIGFSEMLTQEETMRIDAARRREYARLINDSGHHLLSVVNGILDMSKMESGDFVITPEPFAPAQVIRNCCDLLALKAREAGLELTTRFAPELPDVVADKRALKQIMLNLLSNAIKFTDRGGRVTVEARAEDTNFIIMVEDTGIGISATDLPQLGNPFFQAASAYDRRHDGTGLGLSIVKGLVALHGGEVAVSSELGKGTRITIRLPLDCESKRSVEVSNIAQPRFAPETGHELIDVRKSA